MRLVVVRGFPELILEYLRGFLGVQTCAVAASPFGAHRPGSGASATPHGLRRTRRRQSEEEVASAGSSRAQARSLYCAEVGDERGRFDVARREHSADARAPARSPWPRDAIAGNSMGSRLTARGPEARDRSAVASAERRRSQQDARPTAAQLPLRIQRAACRNISSAVASVPTALLGRATRTPDHRREFGAGAVAWAYAPAREAIRGRRVAGTSRDASYPSAAAGAIAMALSAAIAPARRGRGAGRAVGVEKRGRHREARPSLYEGGIERHRLLVVAERPPHGRRIVRSQAGDLLALEKRLVRGQILRSASGRARPFASRAQRAVQLASRRASRCPTAPGRRRSIAASNGCCHFDVGAVGTRHVDELRGDLTRWPRRRSSPSARLRSEV